MTPSSPIQSLADANRLGTRLCIPDLYDEVFQRLQRQNPNLLERSTTLEWGTDYFEPVRRGTCDAVLMTVFEWEAMRVQSAFHADCDMLYPGRPFWATGGGFPMRRDSSVHCTSFLNEVLGAIMAQMDNDGFMEEAYAQYLLRKEDVTCADTQAAEEGRELTVQNMVGGFGIFAVLSLLIVLWAFVVDRRSVHLFKPEVAAVSSSSPQRVAPMRIGRPSQVLSSTRPGDRARTLSGRSMSQRVLEGLREPAAIPTEMIHSNSEGPCPQRSRLLVCAPSLRLRAVGRGAGHLRTRGAGRVAGARGRRGRKAASAARPAGGHRHAPAADGRDAAAGGGERGAHGGGDGRGQQDPAAACTEAAHTMTTGDCKPVRGRPTGG